MIRPLRIIAAAGAALIATAAPANDATDARIARLRQTVERLEQRVDRMKDVQQLENLVSMYAYYLEHFLWTPFVEEVMARDGRIEIAARGVYIGRESIRRHMELYGVEGLHAQELHPHVSLQPVIDVAPDGKTARIRRRGWMIMGTGNRPGVWGEGIYEDIAKKDETGVWRMADVHVHNTFFAPYEGGWKSVTVGRNPGMSTTIPPDLPPTKQYEIFPGVNTPAFHYDNPVTGRVYRPTGDLK